MTSKSVVLIIDLKPRLRRGFEYWLIGLAKNLRERGWEFHIVIPLEASDWFVQEFAIAGGVLHVVAGNRPGFDFWANFSLLTRIKPELLLICFYPMFHPKVLALTRLPWVRKSIYVDQASYEPQALTGWRDRARKWRGQWASTWYERIITVSQFSKNQLVNSFNTDPNRIVIIHNAVRPNFYDSLENSLGESDLPYAGRYVFYAGSLTRDKGVHTLVDACVKLWRSKNSPEFQLWLAGAGPLAEEIQTLARTEGFTSQIRLLGLRDDVPTLATHAAVNVVPSEWPEACAFAALEALAAGRPVIFSDAGSLPDLLGKGGAVFPRRNSEALARALKENLAPQGDHWYRAEQNAQRARHEFGFGGMLGSYLDVIWKAIGTSAQ